MRRTWIWPRPFRSSVRRAGVAVEMVLILPILLILSFGVLELGRMLQVKHRLAVAARIGGRQASLPGVTVAEVDALVRSHLAEYLPAGYAVTVQPSDLENAQAGTPVSVSVSIPWSAVQLTGLFSWADGVWLQESNTYRKETG